MRYKLNLPRLYWSLYSKILISFGLFLIVTMISVFSFFTFFMGSYFNERIDHLYTARAQLYQRLIERIISENVSDPLSQNDDLKEELHLLSEVYYSKLWITDSQGDVVLKSFSEPVPQRVVNKIKQESKSGSENRYYRYRSHLDAYLTKTISPVNGEIYQLHMLYIEKMPERHGFRFAFGLLGISLIIAIFSIPVSRFISRPIKGLTNFVVHFGSGDLTRRVTVKGTDEIAELGIAFNQMADKLNSMIQSGKDLTAQISHELRSPLARIRIAVELLKNGPETQHENDSQRYLYSIQEEIEELDHLIGRILEFSKLDIQETEYKREPISFHKILPELVAKFEPLANEKGIPIHCHVEEGITANTDQDALFSALTNLIDNAIKYVCTKGRIYLDAVRNDDTISIVIRNTVSTSLDLDMEKLFKPFYRPPSETVKGTGLGLAISRKTMRKLRGDVIASKGDDWFEVTVLIPF